MEADPILLARDPSGADPVIRIPPREQPDGLLPRRASAGQSVREWI